jgi:transcriptional regulator with XRE-family HTH domain
MPPAYPLVLVTWGDHLRKKRLDEKLSQKKMGCILGADEASVNNWETGKASPSLDFLPRIVSLLGYVPYPPGQKTIGEKIRFSREALGLTQEQLAEGIQVDNTTLWGWEIGKRRPALKYLIRLDAFFESVGSWDD